jgi:hypothetical protein
MLAQNMTNVRLTLVIHSPNLQLSSLPSDEVNPTHNKDVLCLPQYVQLDSSNYFGIKRTKIWALVFSKPIGCICICSIN